MASTSKGKAIRSEWEAVHYYSEKSEIIIASVGSCIHLSVQGVVTKIEIGLSMGQKVVCRFRLFRRLLRLDKICLHPIFREGSLVKIVVVYVGKVYLIDLQESHYQILEVMRLKNCRNLMHGAICETANGNLVFGEYGTNRERKAVPVYLSGDDGKTWDEVFTFLPGSIKHVHRCQWDPVEEKIWILTGDADGESYFVKADESCRNLEFVGDGAQRWRSCYLFFGDKHIYWGMDSPLEQCYTCRMERETHEVEKLSELPSPVFYGTELGNGVKIISCAAEPNFKGKVEFARVYATTDFVRLVEVLAHRKDGWPVRYMKFGVINLSSGCNVNSVYAFSEAVKGYDGRSELLRVYDNVN